MRPADLSFPSHLSPERSDVDVDVILETVPDDNVTSKTPTIAWAPVLLDRTGPVESHVSPMGVARAPGRWLARRRAEPLLTRTLDGDPAAIRDTFALVMTQCEKFDAAWGRRKTRDKVESWGAELAYFDAPLDG